MDDSAMDKAKDAMAGQSDKIDEGVDEGADKAKDAMNDFDNG